MPAWDALTEARWDALTEATWDGLAAGPLATIQLRRGPAALWTSVNPVLAEGEPGLETDTQLWKTGDGVTAWSGLAYMGGSGGNPMFGW